ISLGEAFFSIYFGLKGESLTLFGFGMDSFIEILSGIGVAHMILRITSNPETNRDAFEKTALRITGLSFYLLVAGLVATVTYNLYLGHKPETTISGIMISLASMILMIALVWGKTRTGKKLQSKAILSDAECTRVCIYMSLILLVSSGIYELTRMPFIDELGTFALAWLSFREGRECFKKAKHEIHCSCGHD
ncbi:MAG: cation transporter, partial [Bacteroidetes bacterium]|nr:cation transporter [Bacteroidota bacterium]